jgi:hypothetical protein
MRIWRLLQCREMGRSRLAFAFVVTVAAAAVATYLLRPRSGLIEPAPVHAQQYFTAFQLDRAEDFRDLQRVLGVVGIGIGIATLGVLAWRRPRALMERLERRPLLGGAAAGAGDVSGSDAPRGASAHPVRSSTSRSSSWSTFPAAATTISGGWYARECSSRRSRAPRALTVSRVPRME